MKTFFLIRNIFRGILLISLLFRWFILDKLNNYRWDVISYALLALGLGGMIISEIIVYVLKKNGKV
jgi:hypothetical protein